MAGVTTNPVTGVIEYDDGSEVHTIHLETLPLAQMTCEIGSLIAGAPDIATGIKAYSKVPYDCLVVGWSVDADVSGDIVLHVFRDGTFPPSTDITGTEKPTLSSQQSNSDVDLTSWTNSWTEGDYIGVSVASVTGLKYCLLTLSVIKL